MSKYYRKFIGPAKVKILNNVNRMSEWNCDEMAIDENWLILYRGSDESSKAIAMFCSPATVIIENEQ